MTEQRIPIFVKFCISGFFDILDKTSQLPDCCLQDLPEQIRFPALTADRFGNRFNYICFLCYTKFFFCNSFHHSSIHHVIPFLPEIIVDLDFLFFRVVLPNLSGRQIRAVLIKHLQFLCRILHQIIDDLRIKIFHVICEFLRLELRVLRLKIMFFIGFPFSDDLTSGSDLSALIQYFFLRPDMFPVFIVEHISRSDLLFGRFKCLSLRKDQMDMEVRFPLIVMEGACHCHVIFFHKLRRKIFQQYIMIVSDQAGRKHDDQLSGFDTFSFCPAPDKICLIFFRQVSPELRIHIAVGGIQVFLSLRIRDITYPAPDVWQFDRLDKTILSICHRSPFRRWYARSARCLQR